MNKDYKWLWFVIILLWMFWMLLLLVTLKVFWDCPALSCGSTVMPTVVNNEEVVWTESHEVIRLLQEAEIHGTKDMTKTEKEIVVANVTHEVIKWPKYTIRVGLQWSRKPIPTINGATTQERAKEWLDKAWLGYTIDTWIRFGEQYKIDYVLPLCVAWADSHLWKALASKNNIGNVWNNDRWDRVEYESMEAWINAIFRALNNKWMGGSTIVGQLSGEGRKRLGIEGCTWAKVNQKCYATSMWVWSTNVTNCMSAIHDRKIDENYHFRLWT